MAVRYNKLWKLLVDRKMSKADLRRAADISSNTLTKLSKDIDVLFNPGYTVDVMKVLISAYKQRPFRLIWSGTYVGGKLIYSEEGNYDYKTYDL